LGGDANVAERAIHEQQLARPHLSWSKRSETLDSKIQR
jgi:hypothetical protein